MRLLLLISLLMPLICSAAPTMPAYTPELFSFEKGLSKDFSGKGLSVSQTRSIIGKSSLQWDWTKKSQEFTFSHDFIRYTATQMKALGAIGQSQVLYFWLYNENPADGEMTVFLGDKTSYDSSFKVNINFKGWRLIHVSLDHHMNLHIPGASKVATQNLKRIKFQAPDNIGNGRLHIDPIMITAYNAALLKSDYQVKLPRVDRVPIEPLLKPGEFYPAPTTEELEAMDRFRAEIIKGAAHAPRGVSIEKAREKMIQLEIEEVNGVIKGRHLSEYYHIDAFYPDQLSPDDKKDFDRIVLLDRGRYGLTNRFTKFYVGVAKSWYVATDSTIKAELADIAVLLSRYILDQGFAEGSSLMSYNFWHWESGELYRAATILQNLLADRGYGREMARALQYMGGESFHRIEPRQDISPTEFAKGTGNALTFLLMDPNDTTRHMAMKKFQHFVNQILTDFPVNREGGFRIDGTVWHHGANYPGYSFDAIKSLSYIAKRLSNSPYALSDDAIATLKTALMTTWRYTNPYIPHGARGRHPDGDWSMDRLSGAFEALAKAGPELDLDLAEAHMKMTNKTPEKSIKSFGIEVAQAKFPEGFWSINSGGMAAQRHGTTLAIMKGYNKQIWSAEIYPTENRYGRYDSHGSVHVMPRGGDSKKLFGYFKHGWDWNRNPGTTTTYLDWDELESPDPGSMKHHSKEGVSGSVALGEENGLFVFNHIEHSGPKNAYDDSFRANKYVVTSGDTLYLHGNNISNDHTANTETTLYQIGLTDNNRNNGIVINDKPIKDFPYETTLGSGDWIIDDNGTGFLMMDVGTVKLQRKEQESPKHNGPGGNQIADFSIAWIDHGPRPDNTKYTYVMVLEATPERMKELAQKSKTEAGFFKIGEFTKNKQHLQIDGGKVSAYFAKEHSDFSEGPIKSINKTGLLVTKMKEDEMQLSISSPELFVENVNDTKIVREYEVLLKGEWELKAGEANVYSSGDETVLEITSKWAMSNNITLTKITSGDGSGGDGSGGDGSGNDGSGSDGSGSDGSGSDNSGGGGSGGGAFSALNLTMTLLLLMISSRRFRMRSAK